tara:strand:+ start:109 stop:930 length:822 start_codon:yes stop_codon:yes gene_type:complete
LYYYGARYYDAGIGRFISVDPVSGNIFNPQRLNRYAYTLNNPLKYVDVNGEDEEAAAVFIPENYHLTDPDVRTDVIASYELDVLNLARSSELDVSVYLLEQEGIGELYDLFVDMESEGIIRSFEVLIPSAFVYYAKSISYSGRSEYVYSIFLGHGNYIETDGKPMFNTYLVETYSGTNYLSHSLSDPSSIQRPVCVEMYNCALSQVEGGVISISDASEAIAARSQVPEGERPFEYILDLYRGFPVIEKMFYDGRTRTSRDIPRPLTMPQSQDN